jgi:spermidine/putrescine transport system permease protein
MKPSYFPRICLVATLLFLYLPILILVSNSFNASLYGAAWQGWTLEWYYKLWQHRPLWGALRNSCIIGLTATFASTLLGTLSALAIFEGRGRLKQFHKGMIYAPLVLPEVLIGISLLLFFVLSGVRLGLGTLFIAHTSFSLSYVCIQVLNSLTHFDRSTIEAAQDLGASWWTTMWRIVLPQLLPGIQAAALLAFTLSFDDFVITYFLAGPGSTTLPVYIYGMMKYGQTPIINALSTVILGLSLLVLYGVQRLAPRIRS